MHDHELLEVEGLTKAYQRLAASEQEEACEVMDLILKRIKSLVKKVQH